MSVQPFVSGTVSSCISPGLLLIAEMSGGAELAYLEAGSLAVDLLCIGHPYLGVEGYGGCFGLCQPHNLRGGVCSGVVACSLDSFCGSANGCEWIVFISGTGLRLQLCKERSGSARQTCKCSPLMGIYKLLFVRACVRSGLPNVFQSFI